MTFALIDDAIYLTNTDSEIAIAKQALRDAGLESTPIWVGDLDGCGDSHRNGQILFAN